MNNKANRELLMKLIAIHDSYIVNFQACEGCEVCDEICAIGTKMWGKAKRSGPVPKSEEHLTIRYKLSEFF